MSRGEQIKQEIVQYFNEIRSRYTEIKDDSLIDDGAIYYMNANDGTDFDWNINGHCCEFFIFYKESQLGFIKVYVDRHDTMYGYIYLDNGESPAIRFNRTNLHDGDSLYLASLLYNEADQRGIYDSSIDKINFKRELEAWELFVDKENEENDDF